MLNSVSVFNQEVSCPAKFKDYSNIPKNLYDWYYEVFEKGQRMTPPENFDHNITPTRVVKTSSGKVKIEIIKKSDQEILDWCGDTISYRSHIEHRGIEFRMKKPFESVCISNNVVLWKNEFGEGWGHEFSSGRDFTLGTYKIDKTFRSSDRIYFKSGGTIYELNFMNGIPIPKAIANVMDRATRIFDGVLVQEVLGFTDSAYIFSIFPEPQTHIQFTLKQMNNHNILNAKYYGHYMVLRGVDKKANTPKYDTAMVRFDIDYNPTDVKMVADTTDDIEFTVLNNGTVAQIPEDGKLEIFSLKGGIVREIHDNSILSDWRLCTDGNKVLAVDGTKLLRISLL